MQFLLYPGFTEEEVHEKILSDEAIFLDEAVYQFVMFARKHDFKGALEEVSEGLEFSPEYIASCALVGISKDGEVVLLFKPEESPKKTSGEIKVLPELIMSIGSEKPIKEEDSDSDSSSDPDDLDWL